MIVINKIASGGSPFSFANVVRVNVIVLITEIPVLINQGSKTKQKLTLGYLSNTNATAEHEVDLICEGENENRITLVDENGVILNEEEGMIVEKKSGHGRLGD
ncbi:hypothetical protein CQW23_01558 [Capsicum baccatum]|uniref:Uncharacterized protein n=1 Tax=Capsicum baccatum TaxID=33114 RepID=A0A2G2XNX5_CAPBA|nr:hypothetical protein CQW23_01558 [Capsicum baccatum]